jgi:hypothetical protein
MFIHPGYVYMNALTPEYISPLFLCLLGIGLVANMVIPAPYSGYSIPAAPRQVQSGIYSHSNFYY